MNKIPIFSATGSKKSAILAPVNFRQRENPALLAQALRVYEDNLHLILGKTKTRGEVAGSTRKIYRQKGTGFARHGARSAPIFVGGGIAHGPKGIKRILSLPSKMKKQALGLTFSAKLSNNDLVAVEGLSTFKKTKEAELCLERVFNSLKKGKMKITFVIPENIKNYFALRNIKDSTMKIFKNLSPYDVFYGGLIIFDKNIFEKESKIRRPAKKKRIRKEAK